MRATDEPRTSSRYGRRAFLKRVGLGAGAVAVGGGVSGSLAAPVQASPARSRFVSTDPQHFGRIFARLEAFAPANDDVTRSLVELGAQGGLLDAQDQLSAGPVALITDPSLSVAQPGQPAAHRRNDVLRAVRRPRHHVRHVIDAGYPDESAHLSERTDALARSRLGLRCRPGRQSGALRHRQRPGQAVHRLRRGLRGPAAVGGRYGDHRRPAERRAHDHRGAALRLHPVPQQGGRLRARPRSEILAGGFRACAAVDDVALPVAARARVSSALRRAADGRGRTAARPPCVHRRRRPGVHSGRVQRSLLPVRTQHGPALVPRKPRRATTAIRSSASSSTRARTTSRRIQPTCAAAFPLRGVSSAGRPSSISATAR